MRRGTRAAVAGALVLALAAPTMIGTAAAEELETGVATVTPEITTAGSSIRVSSATPCPAPPDGLQLDEIVAGILGGSEPTFATVQSQGRRDWSVPMTVPGDLRNGGYSVLAMCVAGDDEEEAWLPYHLYLGRVIVGSSTGALDPVVRLAGPDRLGTAIAVSQDLVRSDDEYAPVVLARADSFADSVVGAALAQAAGGPLLLTPGDNLSPQVEKELLRVAGEGGPVAVLGGQAAIGPHVVDRLVTLGFDVTRLGGANRYETAVKVAEELLSDEAYTVLLADAHNFADGLLAGSAASFAGQPVFGPYGYPAAVLLTDGGVLPPETKAFLETHPGLTQVAIGAGASAAAPGATPIVGADAAETSVKVAERFFPDPWCVGIASSTDFADGLTGGAHAPRFGGPLLFSDGKALSPAVKAYLESHTAVPIAFAYGGTSAIDEAVVAAVIDAIS